MLGLSPAGLKSQRPLTKYPTLLSCRVGALRVQIPQTLSGEHWMVLREDCAMSAGSVQHVSGALSFFIHGGGKTQRQAWVSIGFSLCATTHNLSAGLLAYVHCLQLRAGAKPCVKASKICAFVEPPSSCCFALPDFPLLFSAGCLSVLSAPCMQGVGVPPRLRRLLRCAWLVAKWLFPGWVKARIGLVPGGSMGKGSVVVSGAFLRSEPLQILGPF